MKRRIPFGLAVLAALAAHAVLAVGLMGHPSQTAVSPRAATVWLSIPTAGVAKSSSTPSGDHSAAAEEPPDVTATRETARTDPATMKASSPAMPERGGAPVHDAATTDEVSAYWPPSDLTQRARMVSPPDLTFHPASGDVKRGGSARLLVLVSQSGAVDKVIVETSTLSDEFREFAVASFYRARFQPGRLDADAVPARVRIEVCDSSG